jgi:hypothetical protein
MKMADTAPIIQCKRKTAVRKSYRNMHFECRAPKSQSFWGNEGGPAFLLVTTVEGVRQRQVPQETFHCTSPDRTILTTSPIFDLILAGPCCRLTTHPKSKSGHEIFPYAPAPARSLQDVGILFHMGLSRPGTGFMPAYQALIMFIPAETANAKRHFPTPRAPRLL